MSDVSPNSGGTFGQYEDMAPTLSLTIDNDSNLSVMMRCENLAKLEHCFDILARLGHT